MARRKNMKRRRIILGNTFHLIRENGMDNVSLQMIAEKSGISKSLLQSYYPHKAKLTNDIIRNLFNTLGQQVNNYDIANSSAPYARTKAFIYTIAILGMHDEGLDRIISEAFVSNATLDNWGVMLNDWIQSNHLFDGIDVDEKELETGIAFVTSGIGRVYHDRKKHQLTAEALADYATSALMFSFLHCSSDEIDHALKEGHEIIESADMEVVHRAIDTMFDEGKEIFS